MIWEALLGIVIAIVIYNVIHHLFVVGPIKRRQLKAETHCEGQLVEIISQFPDAQYNFKVMSARVLSEVWGRGIQVFEFKIAADQFDVAAKMRFLQTHFAAVAKANPKLARDLKMTDLWQSDQFIRIELASMTNQATREYVDDIQRLTES